jgi:hypothetical protein
MTTGSRLSQPWRHSRSLVLFDPDARAVEPDGVTAGDVVFDVDAAAGFDGAVDAEAAEADIGRLTPDLFIPAVGALRDNAHRDKVFHDGVIFLMSQLLKR